MKSPTIEYWEKIEKNPTKGYKEFFIEEEKFLIKNIKRGSIILDLGCGTGRITKVLSNISKKVYGIDNDKKAVEKCKKNLKKLSNVKISLEDAEDMSFKNNTFDFVVCMGATFDNFGKTKTKILSEIKRVLKDKSIFILSVYNENALQERLRFYNTLNSDFKINKNGTVIFNEGIITEQYSKKNITKTLKESNFKVTKIKKGKIFYLVEAKNEKPN